MKKLLTDVRWLGEQLPGTVISQLVPFKVSLWYAMRRGNIDLRRYGIPQHVTDNIRSTFADRTDDRIERMARQHIEFCKRLDLHNALTRQLKVRRRWWTVNGREHLDSSLALGRGALLVSAHFGHVRLISTALRAYGYEPRLVRMMGVNWSERNQRWHEKLANGTSFKRFVFRNLIVDPRELQDIRADIDIRPILSALSRNQPVIVLGDGLRSSEFVALPLLGKTYPFPVGFMKIARLTGAPVLPAFAVETGPEFELRIAIQPPLLIDPLLGVAANMEKFSASLDEQLRLTPHQWHRWSIVNVFENANEWSRSNERWNSSFAKWCAERRPRELERSTSSSAMVSGHYL
jgi:KDO2-lipid IV(A) lauroyltransferase